MAKRRWCLSSWPGPAGAPHQNTEPSLSRRERRIHFVSSIVNTWQTRSAGSWPGALRSRKLLWHFASPKLTSRRSNKFCAKNHHTSRLTIAPVVACPSARRRSGFRGAALCMIRIEQVCPAWRQPWPETRSVSIPEGMARNSFTAGKNPSSGGMCIRHRPPAHAGKHAGPSGSKLL